MRSKPEETPTMRLMRELAIALLLLAPWFLTPFIIIGAMDSPGGPQALTEQLKRFPPITKKQHEAYCTKERKEWTLWHDPECFKSGR